MVSLSWSRSRSGGMVSLSWSHGERKLYSLRQESFRVFLLARGSSIVRINNNYRVH